MHPQRIIAHIYERNSNVNKVAETLQVKAATVSRVIHGKATSRNIATYISGFIKIPLDDLWPGVYVKQYKHKVRAA